VQVRIGTRLVRMRVKVGVIATSIILALAVWLSWGKDNNGYSDKSSSTTTSREHLRVTILLVTMVIEHEYL
ncbi:hypothetical protein BDF22DRAFT_672489, partial [Syncephalis plumigaleata]